MGKTKKKSFTDSNSVKASGTQTSSEAMLNSLPTKSAKIRYLSSIGLTRGQIAKKLDIRYQHVRNVLIAPLKKS